MKFIGRKKELSELNRLLKKNQLVLLSLEEEDVLEKAG